MKSVITILPLYVFMAGCISYPLIEDVEKRMADNPVVPKFWAPDDPPMEISPLGRDALVGKWKCRFKVSQGLYSHSDELYPEDYAEECQYEFRDDGTYTFTSLMVFEQATPIALKPDVFNGKWEYEDGRLTLFETYSKSRAGTSNVYMNLKKHYRVGWHSNNQVFIGWLSQDDANEFDRQRQLATPNWQWRSDHTLKNNGVEVYKSICVDTVKNGKEYGWATMLVKSPPWYDRIGAPKASPRIHSLYRIVRFERNSKNGFSYEFILEPTGKNNVGDIQKIMQDFQKEVIADYLVTYPSAQKDALHLMLDCRMQNGNLEGRASVLTIIPISLDYDSATRHGTMSVRCLRNQVEEARSFVVKNLKKLANDKNIAITTGSALPSDMGFLHVKESVLEGNVLKVKFVVE